MKKKPELLLNELDIYNYNFICTKVIDADTIEGDIDLGFKMNITKVRLRVAGIDAPEVRGKEKKDGIKAKNYVIALLENSKIKIKSYYFDSFGRIIADVFFLKENSTEWVNLSIHLLEQELVKVYVK